MSEIMNTALESAAGSGKTRELTKHFLRLFLDDAGIPLNTLYGITFTNEASREMKRRILQYLNLLAQGQASSEPEQEIIDYFRELFPDAAVRARQRREHLIRNLSDLNISTFHSLFASFLSSIPFAAGIAPGYRILDETEAERLFNDVLDRFFDEFHRDRRLAADLRELAETEETSPRTVLRQMYDWLQPYLPGLAGLIQQETAVRRRVEECRQKLADTLDEFRRFVADHESAGHTRAGVLDKRFAVFLQSLDEFRGTGRIDCLPESVLDGSYAGLQYLQKFLHNLGEEDRGFLSLLGRLDEQVRAFLAARSDEQLVIHLKPMVELHQQWLRVKQEQNLLSFDDIETRTLQALTSGLDTAYLYFKIGAHIRHLLIDEFQDTSLRQLAILEPIIEEITSVPPPEKSLFYVGDPHQAIFRWRGGASELFDYLRHRYPGKIKKERLPCNRRSSQNIVAFVNLITDRHDQPAPAAPAGWVRVLDLGLAHAEEGRRRIWDKVLELIQQLHDQGGYEYRDLAVLTRRNQPARELTELLVSRGIPVLSRSSADLLSNPDVRLVCRLLRFLDNPEDDFSLSHILLNPIFQDGAELLVELQKPPLARTRYLALVRQYPDRAVTRLLGSLLAHAHVLDPYALIRRMIAECGLALSHGLAALLDAASQFIREQSTSLSAFLEWLDQAGPAIEIPSSCLNGVSVLTAHKAKGLEFEVVMVAETFYQPRFGENRHLLVGYKPGELEPDRVYWRACARYDRQLLEAEARRLQRDEMNLLYVALTRARQGLYVLGYRTGKEPGKPAGIWFSEIAHRAGPEFSCGEIMVRSASRPSPPPAPYQPPRAAAPTAREERALYSPTERRVEIIEPRRRRLLQYGEIVHKALSRIAWLTPATAGRAAMEAAVYVAKRYGRQPAESQRLEEQVHALLERTFLDPELRPFFYPADPTEKVYTERAVYYEEKERDVSVYLDRLIIGPGRIVIIDYKTGAEAEEYADQLRAYRRGVALLYPGRIPETIIIYLENESGKKIVRIE